MLANREKDFHESGIIASPMKCQKVIGQKEYRFKLKELINALVNNGLFISLAW